MIMSKDSPDYTPSQGEDLDGLTVHQKFNNSRQQIAGLRDEGRMSARIFLFISAVIASTEVLLTEAGADAIDAQKADSKIADLGITLQHIVDGRGVIEPERSQSEFAKSYRASRARLLDKGTADASGQNDVAALLRELGLDLPPLAGADTDTSQFVDEDDIPELSADEVDEDTLDALGIPSLNNDGEDNAR